MGLMEKLQARMSYLASPYLLPALILYALGHFTNSRPP
jgi:hypothetical protein